MSKACLKVAAPCPRAGFPTPGSRAGYRLQLSVEVPVPDNVAENDALKQRKFRLVTRVRNMIKVLEMEFGATPDEILTTVAMSLKDHDANELAEILDTTSSLLDMLMPGNSPYKARRR